MQQRAVDVMAVSFSLYHKMNHPEVTTLNDQWTSCGGEGELLHRGYMVVQNLQGREREREGGRDIYIYEYILFIDLGINGRVKKLILKDVHTRISGASPWTKEHFTSLASLTTFAFNIALFQDHKEVQQIAKGTRVTHYHT